MHEMDTYRVHHICMIELKNCWMDFKEVGMDIMPLEATLKSYFSFSSSVIPTRWMHKFVRGE
jgi:hypothetical protein